MKIFAIILFLFSASSNGFSTRETVLKVYQPILVEEGLEESVSTYLQYIGHPLPSLLMLTCASNHIETQDGVRNRNIANLCNLELDLVNNEFGLPIFIDTVKIKLKIPPDFGSNKDYPNLNPDNLILITIECVKKNARSFNSIKYLDVEIIGEAKYQKFSKLYEL